MTPTSYLELINSFNGLLGLKKGEVQTAKDRYDNGLDKIMSTEVMVEGMQKELIEKKTDNSELVRLEDQVVTCLESRQPCGEESSPAAKLEGDGSAGGKRFIDVINCFAGVGTEDVRLVSFASE